MNISSAARAVARRIAAPFVAMGRFARSLLYVKNVARAAPPSPSSRTRAPHGASPVQSLLITVSSPQVGSSNASKTNRAPLIPFDPAAVMRCVADAVTQTLKKEPLATEAEKAEMLTLPIKEQMDQLTLRGELRANTVADASDHVMNMSNADLALSMSDSKHVIRTIVEAALKREQHEYASVMKALGKEADIDRLVDQFLKAEEQLKQNAVDSVFPASRGH